MGSVHIGAVYLGIICLQVVRGDSGGCDPVHPGLQGGDVLGLHGLEAGMLCILHVCMQLPHVGFLNVRPALDAQGRRGYGRERASADDGHRRPKLLPDVDMACLDLVGILRDISVHAYDLGDVYPVHAGSLDRAVARGNVPQALRGGEEPLLHLFKGQRRIGDVAGVLLRALQVFHGPHDPLPLPDPGLTVYQGDRVAHGVGQHAIPRLHPGQVCRPGLQRPLRLGDLGQLPFRVPLQVVWVRVAAVLPDDALVLCGMLVVLQVGHAAVHAFDPQAVRADGDDPGGIVVGVRPVGELQQVQPPDEVCPPVPAHLLLQGHSFMDGVELHLAEEGLHDPHDDAIGACVPHADAPQASPWDGGRARPPGAGEGIFRHLPCRRPFRGELPPRPPLQAFQVQPGHDLAVAACGLGVLLDHVLVPVRADVVFQRHLRPVPLVPEEVQGPVPSLQRALHPCVPVVLKPRHCPMLHIVQLEKQLSSHLPCRL